MKNRNLFGMLCFALLIILITAGCQRIYEYSFAQSKDNVEKVEICAYDYDTQTTTPLVVLNEGDTNELLQEIDAMECKRHFGDHTQDYGEIVVYISYKNQTAEVIGLCNVAQVDKNGKWHIGIEYFDASQLCSLIMKYVNADLLPDLSKYLN